MLFDVLETDACEITKIPRLLYYLTADVIIAKKDNATERERQYGDVNR